MIAVFLLACASAPEPIALPEPRADLGEVLAASKEGQEHFDAGYRLARSGKPLEALCAFQACIAVAPARLDCHWESGWVYWKLEDWQKNVEVWSYVVDQDADYPNSERWLKKARAELDDAQKSWSDEASFPEGGRIVQGVVLTAEGDFVGCTRQARGCKRADVVPECE